jgi:hypothetical protein
MTLHSASPEQDPALLHNPQPTHNQHEELEQWKRLAVCLQLLMSVADMIAAYLGH